MNVREASFPANRILRKYLAMWIAQGRRCYLCGGKMRDAEHPSPGAPTKDHVRPRVQGFRLRRNVLLAHRSCNMRKGARDPHPCELIYLESIHLMLEGVPSCR